MKKELHPAVVVIAIVCVLAIAGFFVKRAMTDKPAYPGLMAGHPGQGSMQPPPMANGRVTPESARKMGFSGVNPDNK